MLIFIVFGECIHMHKKHDHIYYINMTKNDQNNCVCVYNRSRLLIVNPLVERQFVWTSFKADCVYSLHQC